MDQNFTPLHDLCIAAGGRMVSFAGWEMPVQFSGLMAEHKAVRSDIGMFDISHMEFCGLKVPIPKMLCKSLYRVIYIGSVLAKPAIRCC